MALLPKGAWIVVADGEKAMFLENEGTPVAPKLKVIEKLARDPDAADRADSDRPGRMPDPGPGQLSAMEHPDFQREEAMRFARKVAERLDKRVAKAGVKRLVIAAPPQSLSALREHLSARINEALIAALPKTLTHHPVDRIAKLVVEDIDPL